MDNASTSQGREPPSRNNPAQSTDDPPLIIFDDEDVDAGVTFCSKSLVGKILTDKPIHTNRLQSALSGIWCHPKGFRVEELSTKVFQFFFEDDRDVNRILTGSPWLFRNSWLNLKRWERGSKVEDLNFSNVPVHIQLWGLPNYCKTKKMGQRIGPCMGVVTESEIYEVRDKGTFIRLRVMMDISKPLKAGIHAGNHSEEFCPAKDTNEGNKENNHNTRGPWMRAPQTGGRIGTFSTGDTTTNSGRQNPH
ncbi:hypothetical protein SESBI_03049 [Sesbania bispinosa]|nr:hypothetical protein SESBI_03049 [Sesbania bispinosa]